MSNFLIREKSRDNTMKTTALKVTLTKPDCPSVELDATTEVTQTNRISSRTGSDHTPDHDDAFMASESTPNICIPSQAELLELLKMKRDKMGGLGSRKSSVCHVRITHKPRRHTQE